MRQGTASRARDKQGGGWVGAAKGASTEKLFELEIRMARKRRPHEEPRKGRTRERLRRKKNSDKRKRTPTILIKTWIFVDGELNRRKKLRTSIDSEGGRDDR